MTTVVLIDGRLGLAAARFLAERGELAGAVLHPEGSRRYVSPEAVRAVADVPVWSWPDGLPEIVALAPDYLLSVLFLHRIPVEWLDAARTAAVNLHPGYLPYNRGRGAAAWPLIDGTPAGATLHVMDEQFDTGPILAREQVPVHPEDTRATLFERIESAALGLLSAAWPRLHEIQPLPQDRGAGTRHTQAELDAFALTEADFPLLDRLRATSYRGHGLPFERNGQRYEAIVTIRQID
jgi:methionyl-tRNA formyltransferase